MTSEGAGMGEVEREDAVTGTGGTPTDDSMEDADDGEAVARTGGMSTDASSQSELKKEMTSFLDKETHRNEIE